MFGDGTVILRSTPGHTPGHQSPYVKLAKTGGVLLSADAYHYRQSCTLQRVPKFDSNQEQSRATRAMVEELLRKTGTELWIQHDYFENTKLKRRRHITTDPVAIVAVLQQNASEPLKSGGQRAFWRGSVSNPPNFSSSGRESA